MQMNPEFTFEGVDLFCGAGGTTEGIERAQFFGNKIARVVACINHDPWAIYSHSHNHRNVKHFTEDIRTFNLNHLPKLESSDSVKTYIWASAECTNLSNAKGGMSRDADSRTLAEHLDRYIEYLKPDYIPMENVREFLDWGPLMQKRDKETGKLMYDKKGKPIMVPDPAHKGEDYKKWVEHIKSYGYDYDYRLLTAADFGANTTRKRYFGIFAKKGLPIVFPKPTHSRTGKDGLKKWRPVREVLDLNDHGKSIFREKPLSEATYKRIYAGLVKFIAHGDTSFLAQYNSGSEVNRVLGLNTPCNTVTTCNRFALVTPEFLMKYHGNGENILSLEDSCSTITTKDRLALIHTDFFLDEQYSQGKQNQSIDQPAGAILTVPKEKLVIAESLQFMDEQYGRSKGRNINAPAGSIVTNPKQNLVTTEQMWLMDTNYNNIGSTLDRPAPVVLASKRYSYLVVTETGHLALRIDENDSEYVKKIKMFMAAYGIIDVKMRMLKIAELLAIQGFPRTYILKGTQTQKKKFIGNAVVPVVAQKLFEALYEGLLKHYKMAA